MSVKGEAMRACLAVLVLLGFNLTGLAASLDPTLLLESADVCAFQTSTTETCIRHSPPLETGGPLSVSGTVTISGASITGSGFGEAEYGVLRASSSSSFDISPSPKSARAFGVAAFRDVITINYAPWNGSHGLMYVNYTLDGTVSTTGKGVAGVNVETYGGPTDSQVMFQNYVTSESGTFNAPASINFIYGQPFNLGLELYTAAGTADPNDLLGVTTTTGSGSGSAIFSNTLILSGLIPTDMDGVEATDPSFSSASGTEYTIDGVVPEPNSASLALIGAVFCCLALTCTYSGKQKFDIRGH